MPRWTPFAMPEARRTYRSALRRQAGHLADIVTTANLGALAVEPEVRQIIQSTPDARERMSESARRAQLLWVTSAMTQVADVAAMTIPTHWDLAACRAEPDGILSWERSPIRLKFTDSHGTVPLHAVHWETVGNQLRVHWLTLASSLPPTGPVLHRPADFWAHLDTLNVPFTNRSPRWQEDLAEIDRDALNLFVATLLLAGQTKIAETSDSWAASTTPNTPARPTHGVKVIDLRRRATTEARKHQPTRILAHDFRWEVGHHWRTQHYGPRNALTKLVFIQDYEAGPEDKPLRPRSERVYRLSR